MSRSRTTTIAAALQTLQLHHLGRLLRELHARGIDVAPLKGAELVTTVYADVPFERSMGDVDLLVRPPHWGRAIEVMLDLGLRPRYGLTEERDAHEIGFRLVVAPGRSILFELHRYLLEPRRFPIGHDAIWRRAMPSELDGVPCWRLSAEDHLVHLCLHAALHRFMHLERTLRDVELLLRAGARPAMVARIAREWRATRAVWVVATLLVRGDPDLESAAQLARWLAPPWLARQALAHLVVPGSPSAPLVLSHRLGAATLWPWIFDSPPLLLRFVANHPIAARRALGLRRIFAPGRESDDVSG